ncbi:hypothetical protein POTOM_000890 [Populus tomentosa]|uniref:Uncharacterized protein n=1 Tax=Populus tomentosa TaxID=118781 RepID=A0A8X8IUQ4_POPTO|nr:hypothetical protein POTOM_000890 [Populus tomentosa]
MDSCQVTTDLVKFSNPANILQRDFIVGAMYEDRNQTVLNNMINSELSLAAGSLPTGANSAVLKGLLLMLYFHLNIIFPPGAKKYTLKLKAVHETVNDQLHVVHEGKLRIIIVHNLKVSYGPLNESSGFHNTLILFSQHALQILSWEFCSRDLEELCCLEVQFYLRSSCMQVNELVYASKKYRTTVDDIGSDRVYHHLIYKKIATYKKLKLILVPQCFPTDPNKLSTSHFPSGNSNDNSIMSKGGLLNSSDMVRHCIFPKSCMSSNVGKLEQPSLLNERCERSASSTPSQVPQDFEYSVGISQCQEQDAATDGMTFDHKTLVAVASGMHQVVLWKIPGAGFMVASNADSHTW